ncbi:serine carboxypeptidase-like 48 [Arachis hypogaea]
MTSLYKCNAIFSRIMSIAGNINVWYHKKTVRDALGVGDLDFVSCSSTVYDAMMQEWMRNLEVGIPALLEDEIQVLVYAGEEDLICNWLGNSRWVHAMEWSGQNEFGAASTIPFLVDGTAAGTLKSHGPLAFLKVNEAGHMVPMDQPKAALQMLTNWMQGKLTPKKSGANVSPK